MMELVTVALSLISTTYGHQEMYCGDYDKPEVCAKGAITASGEEFDPNKATAAIPAPKNKILRPFYVWIKDIKGRCRRIKVNDKANEKWIGKRGLDLTPGALRKLGIKPTKHWSGRLELCSGYLQ